MVSICPSDTEGSASDSDGTGLHKVSVSLVQVDARRIAIDMVSMFWRRVFSSSSSLLSSCLVQIGAKSIVINAVSLPGRRVSVAVLFFPVWCRFAHGVCFPIKGLSAARCDLDWCRFSVLERRGSNGFCLSCLVQIPARHIVIGAVSLFWRKVPVEVVFKQEN